MGDKNRFNGVFVPNADHFNICLAVEGWSTRLDALIGGIALVVIGRLVFPRRLMALNRRQILFLWNVSEP